MYERVYKSDIEQIKNTKKEALYNGNCDFYHIDHTYFSYWIHTR